MQLLTNSANPSVTFEAFLAGLTVVLFDLFQVLLTGQGRKGGEPKGVMQTSTHHRYLYRR